MLNEDRAGGTEPFSTLRSTQGVLQGCFLSHQQLWSIPSSSSGFPQLYPLPQAAGWVIREGTRGLFCPQEQGTEGLLVAIKPKLAMVIARGLKEVTFEGLSTQTVLLFYDSLAREIGMSWDGECTVCLGCKRPLGRGNWVCASVMLSVHRRDAPSCLPMVQSGVSNPAPPHSPDLSILP